jgi:hypothetical protein
MAPSTPLVPTPAVGIVEAFALSSPVLLILNPLVVSIITPPSTVLVAIGKL